jgi:hypothetical protein
MNLGTLLTCFLVRYVEVANLGHCRPERWENLPEAVNALPSVYGHLVTFIAGAHSCIGYRFTIVECVHSLHYSRLIRKWNAEALIYLSYNCSYRIKALLFTLVRAFEFELAVSAEDIVRKSGVVGRPVIASNPAAGPQLPLLIRPASMD